MLPPNALVAGVLCLASAAQAFRTSLSLKDFREQMENARSRHRVINARDDVDPATLYPEYNLSVPIDHFHNDSAYEPHSHGHFNLRYWFDATHYKPGGPVIVLQSGETDGEGRLPFLQKGIVAQLAEATGGLGVILEHRYYGTSMPTEDLSTENLRFLTTDQALADMAYFAKNVVYERLEHLDLTAPKNAYIAYGGSYAGAFVAFLRKVYPDVYWGAISSSGVTEAIWDYWQYFDAVRIYGPKDCVSATQKLTHVIDNILIGKSHTGYPAKLRQAFGLGNLSRSDDFANAINGGIYGLQGTNWDPAQNDTSYGDYCDDVSSDELRYPKLKCLTSEVRKLIKAGGYGHEVDELINPMLNYIGFVNETVVAPCAAKNSTQEHCFTNYNSTYYQQDDISQMWRSWPYQYCTEWGYLQTGSGVPAHQLPLISRLIDVPFSSIVCREAFNISTPANVEAVNRHGGFGISYPRLAIVDGEHDPWRAVTPHALGQPDRKSTTSEPFILIPKGVHHWDENGLFPNETVPGVLPPPAVADAQHRERKFVLEWMKEWKHHCKGTDGASGSVDWADL